MTIENCQSKNGDDLKNAKQMTLDVIEPTDPNYHKPIEELIEDLGHADAGRQYGDVIITVEDLTDAIYYLQEYQKLCNLKLFIPDGYMRTTTGSKNR